MTDHRYDEDVLGPIIGRDADDPAMLWELVSSVDAIHQTFIGLDDLAGALARLAAAGAIRELPGHRYVDAACGAGSALMTPLTLFEWEAAVAEFQAEFERLNAEANEPYPRLRIVCPSRDGGRPFAADIRRARDLRDQLTSALSLAGVTSMTAEVAAGDDAVTFWIAGFDEMGPGRMELVARPVLLAAAPAGSSMTIDLWDALAEDELPEEFWVIAPAGG